MNINCLQLTSENGVYAIMNILQFEELTAKTVDE